MAQRVKGSIGGNYRKPPNFTKRGSRPRILTARDPFTFLTTQRSRAYQPWRGAVGISKNVFKQGGLPRVGKAGVRRIFRRDPYNKLSQDSIPPYETGATEATMSPEADRMTSNTNPRFHPEEAPGAVSSRVAPKADVGGASVGRQHGKVISPNRQTLLGGKTIRRR